MFLGVVEPPRDVWFWLDCVLRTQKDSKEKFDQARIDTCPDMIGPSGQDWSHLAKIDPWTPMIYPDRPKCLIYGF